MSIAERVKQGDERYRPVTLPGDDCYYFVGEYDEKGFKGLVSIHDAPWKAVEEADRLNAT